MAPRPLVIIGAGGLGREFLDVLRSANGASDRWAFKGFVADDEPPSEILQRIDAEWLGPVESCLSDQRPASYVIGIGHSATRERIATLADEAGWEPATLVHPSASIGTDVILGPGTVVCSHVTITTNIRLGSHVVVNFNSAIGHDSTAHDFATINPLVAVSGSVTLGQGATMGTTSSVLQGLRIGDWAMVGAGAVVTKDVPPGATVVGVPARPMA